METNNPPNATDFAKKSSARNKRRYTKRKTANKPVKSAPVSAKEIENNKWFLDCLLLILLATAIKELFDTPNAD